MKLLESFLAAFLLALATIQVVDAASLRAAASDADDSQRLLEGTPWPPPYLRPYKEAFPEANFQRCTIFLEDKGIAPVNGTKCHKRVLVGDYTCMVGSQTCDSTLVPTTTEHPAKLCSCDISTGELTCLDWNPCGDSDTRPIEVSSGSAPALEWTRPSYWKEYRETFPLLNLQPCLFLELRGIMNPQGGEKCHKRQTGNYTCVFGSQTCESDMVSTTEHPQRTCKCDVATGTLVECDDWSPCRIIEETIDQSPPAGIDQSPPSGETNTTSTVPETNTTSTVPETNTTSTVPETNTTSTVPGTNTSSTAPDIIEVCPAEIDGSVTCDPLINNQACPVGVKMCPAGCYTDEMVDSGPIMTCSCSDDGFWMCWAVGCGLFHCPPQILECPLVPPRIGDFCAMNETEICSYGTSQCSCGDEKLKLFKCGATGLIEEAEPLFAEYCWGVCPEDDPEFPHAIEGSSCTESGGVGEDCTCNCGDVPCGPKYICDCTEGTYSCRKRFNFRRTLSCVCELPEVDSTGEPLYSRDPSMQCPDVAPTVDDDCDGLEGERCGYDEVCGTKTSTHTCSKGKWLARESWVPLCHEPLATCPASKPTEGMPCEFSDETMICDYGHSCGCGEDKMAAFQCVDFKIQAITEEANISFCDLCPEDDPDFPWEIEGTNCTEDGGVGIDCHCSCNAPCGPQYYCTCTPSGTYSCVKQWSNLMSDCACAAPPTDENGMLINQPDPDAVCPPTEPTPGENCTGLYNQRCGYDEVCGTNTTTYDCNQWNGEWNQPRSWIPLCPDAA